MGFFDFFKRKGSAEDRQQQQKKEEEKAKGISKPFTEMGFAELEEVVDGIDDQQALFEIVTRPQIIGTAEEKVLKKAMRRLTDPELLGRISVMENRPYAARLAVQSGRLPQESVARIAKFGYDPVIKLDAARQLYNTELIVDALVTQPALHDDTVEYSRIVNTLVGKLNHPADLQRVIDNAESRWVASYAEKKLATIPIPDKDEPSARDGDGNLIHMHYADALPICSPTITTMRSPIITPSAVTEMSAAWSPSSRYSRPLPGLSARIAPCSILSGTPGTGIITWATTLRMRAISRLPSREKRRRPGNRSRPSGTA